METKTLRHATLEDVPHILDLAETLFEDSSYNDIKLDRLKARQNLEKFIIEAGVEYLCLISIDGEKTVGVLAAYAFKPLFSSEKIAVEVLWYLEEAARKSTRGVEMMEAFEYWAKLVGCKTVQYGFLESSPKGMINLYLRRGAKKTETVYTKVLK